TKRLLDGFDKLCPHNMSRGPGPICDECWVIWGAEEIERLLAGEREKVREMCVKAVKEMWREDEEMDERERGYIRAVRDGMRKIRQLDLTKDLAPSSTDEGKECRINVGNTRLSCVPGS
ncbi:hypothetical protein LCGC14_2602840, partial [marine sediment metagenome]